MISMIAAVDKNNGIGKDNDLLTHIGPDLKHFKEMTVGKTVVMGYSTFLSLPNGPLPNRKNIILSRQDIEIEGATVLHSLEEVISLSDAGEDIVIIGGGSVYEQALPYAKRLYITYIPEEFEADTFFPEIKKEEWALKGCFARTENIKHQHPHLFATYYKKQ